MLPHVKSFEEAYKSKKPIYLPKYKHEGIMKTLIFDIDETMIHCLEDSDYVPDVIIKIPLDETFTEFADAGINLRPHLYECLR
jgi:NLI interacting factor-like phosphatase